MNERWIAMLFWKAEFKFTKSTQTWLLPDVLNEDITKTERVWQSQAG